MLLNLQFLWCTVYSYFPFQTWYILWNWEQSAKQFRLNNLLPVIPYVPLELPSVHPIQVHLGAVRRP